MPSPHLPRQLWLECQHHASLATHKGRSEANVLSRLGFATKQMHTEHTLAQACTQRLRIVNSTVASFATRGMARVQKHYDQLRATLVELFGVGP